MPVLRFITTLPANEIPNDFEMKMALLMVDMFDQKLFHHFVHVMSDHNIFSGTGMDSIPEHRAYAVLRNVGDVRDPEQNRKAAKDMELLVKQELGINEKYFRLFFIDTDPGMAATNGMLSLDIRKLSKKELIELTKKSTKGQ